MPQYIYECWECGHQTEIVCRIADRPETMPCTYAYDTYQCPGEMRQIITAPAIQGDEPPPWMREFADTRPEARTNKRTGKQVNPVIESRTDYKRYMKDKGLRPTDGPNLSEV